MYAGETERDQRYSDFRYGENTGNEDSTGRKYETIVFS